MPLRLTDAPPAVYALFRAGVRHETIVPAGDAIGLRVVRIDQPIAYIEFGIRAKPNVLCRLGHRMPADSIFSFQGVYRQAVGDKTKLMAATHALPVIEVDGLAAMVTSEKPHVSPRKIIGR
ncbi:hypothetical protein FHT85_002003 [Rhizobium sp. BK312]|jgi:hypothetical protein|nr:hypothetical protein [Rhizobium sp. BK312]